MSLGSSYKVQILLHEGVKSIRRKYSDLDKAGKLNFSFQSLVASLPVFLIYINDLRNCSNALTFRIFTDDTNVFASARDLKVLEKTVNSELKKVKIWCDVNRLSINFTKTNFMIIKSKIKKR